MRSQRLEKLFFFKAPAVVQVWLFGAGHLPAQLRLALSLRAGKNGLGLRTETIQEASGAAEKPSSVASVSRSSAFERFTVPRF